MKEIELGQEMCIELTNARGEKWSGVMCVMSLRTNTDEGYPPRWGLTAEGWGGLTYTPPDKKVVNA